MPLPFVQRWPVAVEWPQFDDAQLGQQAEAFGLSDLAGGHDLLEGPLAQAAADLSACFSVLKRSCVALMVAVGIEI
ncbi:MAG: hypothetical protein H7225_05620 [Massilia sp.]|nr:hypothetical protein [Aquabacterium sp.]